ncbi:MAG TPA: PhzF family phenazine biosynthesis protein [bacterium]|nr:PhzF family phenazine biosynthesis protein [bacterium]
MSRYRYVMCDVFTPRPLAGNQLAVFPDAQDIPDSLLQSLAREMNFSETVFVYPPAGGGHARLRIFTPGREVSFAGHPVLGSAFVLGAPAGGEEVRLETDRGVVPVRLQRNGRGITFAWMRQPLPSVTRLGDESRLGGALGIERSVLPVDVYDNGLRHVYVMFETEDAVARLVPDHGVLGPLLAGRCLNCFAGSGRRWKTRMFSYDDPTGPREDPATGSAAGPLALHLIRHGRLAFGDEIEISQGAETGRPSTLHARVTGRPAQVEDIEVGGQAVVVGYGEFALP